MCGGPRADRIVDAAAQQCAGGLFHGCRQYERLSVALAERLSGTLPIASLPASFLLPRAIERFGFKTPRYIGTTAANLTNTGEPSADSGVYHGVTMPDVGHRHASYGRCFEPRTPGFCTAIVLSLSLCSSSGTPRTIHARRPDAADLLEAAILLRCPIPCRVYRDPCKSRSAIVRKKTLAPRVFVNRRSLRLLLDRRGARFRSNGMVGTGAAMASARYRGVSPRITSGYFPLGVSA